MADYFIASPETEKKLTAFLKGRKPTPYAKASLARLVLEEMGRPTDIINSVTMMFTLQDLYDQRDDYVEVNNVHKEKHTQ